MRNAPENKAGPAKRIRLRNASKVVLHGVDPGKAISVEVDRDGTPLDRHWRRRLQDSKVDGCVEIVPENKTANRTRTDKTVNED